MNTPKTYHSKIYRDFRDIEDNDYRTIVRFYEEYEDEIRQLEFEEYFELLVAFVNALFETGSYKKYLLMVDVVIETTILKNIQLFQGEDIYYNMLFRKAASHFNLMEFGKADYILRELIKMDPFQEETIGFLKKCLRKMDGGRVKKFRNLSLFLFCFSAITIGVELIYITPNFPDLTQTVMLFRNTLFLGGILGIFGSDFIHRIRVNQEVNQFVKEAALNKKI